MRPSPRLVCSILSCLLPWHRPFLRFTFEGWAYHYTRSCPLDCPCRLASSAALILLRDWGVRILNYLNDWLILHSLAGSCVHTGTWCSSTSGPPLKACWAFGSTGKRANSCQRRGSLFSALSLIWWSTKWHTSPGNVLSWCWTASRLYQAGRRSHWNSFRGSWGIWLQLRRQFRPSAPYETASALVPRPNPEVGVETRYSLGSDYTGLLQNLQPLVRSLVPSGTSAPGAGIQTCCTTGTQCQVFGRVPNCDGISIASSCWQCALSWAASEGSFSARTFWSVWTTRLPCRISTGKAVYAPVATRPPPPPLESEASEVPSCHPHPRSDRSSSTSRGVETPSPGGSADLGGWFRAAQVDLFVSPEPPHCQGFYSLTEATLATEMFDQSCVSFLQQGLEHRLSPSTLKAYVAAISAHHGPLEGKSVGKHDLVVRFLRGASKLNPPRPPSLPSWDLALVLRALLTSPLSLCSQLRWSFCLWKLYSWLRWPRARGWGTCKHFLSTIRALSLGRLTPVQHWGPGPAMCPRFLPLPSGTR